MAERSLSVGLARMHQEVGERRDFLPEFAASLEQAGAKVFIENGYGSGMGIDEGAYRQAAPGVRFTGVEEIYHQDIVVVLRYPGEEMLAWMKPGACLVSMVHFPTRPNRIDYLRLRGIEALSLDSIKDDVGRRMVENLRAVGWNGVKVAFNVLGEIYPAPGLDDTARNPVKVTVLGAGAVGMFAIQAAVRYGDQDNWRRRADQGVTGVQVTAVEHDLTNHEHIITQILKFTDILIDATQRPDPSRPVIPNDWIGVMRPYAVLLDLSVDPYEVTPDGRQMIKGIEGVPHGNLDQYIFPPDDPAFENLPTYVNAKNRRWSVSCYSWPGMNPYSCMEIYGKQLAPLLAKVIQAGGPAGIRPSGDYFERAVFRGLLSGLPD